MTTPTIVLIGGFLGAGKTTLMLAAARKLHSAGLRTGVITNDQAGELVDTRYLEAAGLSTEEVAGGCFCCRFSDFVRSAEKLLSSEPHVIFAEPVGSCTDLTATILEPLKRYYNQQFLLAPLTVMVDPERATELQRPGADPHMTYLFEQQIAEADQVWFTKADRHAEFPLLPGIPTRHMSAETGQGVGEWLGSVLSGGTAGQHFLDIDYQEYAEAEAALGWLNWRAQLHLRTPLSPAEVAGTFVDQLDRELTEGAIPIAHLKAFVQAETGFVKVSICGNSEEPRIDGTLIASPALDHDLVLNLRAPAHPESLRDIVETVSRDLPGEVVVNQCESFRPSPPKPEHRLAANR